MAVSFKVKKVKNTLRKYVKADSCRHTQLCSEMSLTVTAIYNQHFFYDHFPLSYQPLSKWIIAKLANNIPE